MSGSTTPPSGGSTPILKLGLDATGVQTGAATAKTAVEGVKTSAKDAAQSWDALTGALDKTAAPANQAKVAVEAVKTATASTAQAVKDATAATGQMTTAMGLARQAALATGQALGQVGDAARVAAQMQQRVNEFAGVQSRSAEDYAKRAADIQAYGQELDRMRARYEPLFAAEMQHKAALEGIAQAQRMGAISAETAAKATTLAEQANRRHTASLQAQEKALHATTAAGKLQGHQLTNLFYQAQDTFVQLSMGQNPFMIAIQQGPQAAMAVGGFGKAWEMATSFITPARLAIGATTAAILAMVVAVETNANRLDSLRAKLRGTREDYLTMADTVTAASKAVATSSTMSGADARAAGGVIGGVRGMANDQGGIERMIRLSGDLAKVMGVEVPQAAERLKKAMEEPGTVARELAASGMFGFNDTLRRQVELLQAQGEKAAAARLVLDQYSQRVAGAAESATLLGRAWNGVGNAISYSLGKLGEWLERGANLPAEVATGIAMGGGLIDQSATVAGREVRLTRELAALQLNSGAPADIQAAVRAQAMAMGLPVGLALGIARTESQFRQTGPNGEVLTSPAGAMGVMQLMPRTAAGLGVDPNNVVQNIIGGLMHLQTLMRDPSLRGPGGQVDESQVAAAYNAGGSRVAGFLAGRNGLKPETWDYIRRVGAEGNLTGAVTMLGRANDGIQGQDFRSDNLRTRTAQAGVLEAALTVPMLDPETATRYREALEKIRAEMVGLRDPMSEINRRAQEQAGLYGVAAGAARDLAAAEQQGREQALTQGKTAAEQVIAGLQAREQAQARLRGQMNDSLVVMAQQADSERVLAAVTAQGGVAVAEMEARRKAMVEALRTEIEGTDAYKAAVERLTGAYLNLSQSQVDRQSAMGTAENGRQIAYLEAEVRLVGSSASERERELAALRAREQILSRGGDVNSAASRGLIASSEQLAQQRLDTDRIKSAYNEISSFGVNAFGKIGSAITEAFVQGRIESVKLSGVLKGLLSEFIQLFGKMAVLNPLTNAFFGTNNASLFGGGGGGGGALGGLLSGAGSMIGGLFGGGGSTLENTGTSSGLFGWLGGLFGGGGAATAAGGAATVIGSGFNLGRGPLSGVNGGVKSVDGGTSINPIDAASLGYKVYDKFGSSSGVTSETSFIGRAAGSVSDFMGSTAYTVGAETVPQGAAYYGEAMAAGQTGATTTGGASVSYGSAIGGGAAIVTGGIAVHQGIERGGVGGYTSAAGGAVSMASGAAMMGMLGPGMVALGPYGLIAAAIIMAIGAMLPGQKPSNRVGASIVDLASGSQTEFGAEGDKFSQENRTRATGLIDSLEAMADAYKSFTGYRPEGVLTTNVGDRDGMRLDYTTAERAFGARNFSSDEAGQKEMMRQAAVMFAEASHARWPEALQRAWAGVAQDSAENVLTGLAKIAAVTGGGNPTENQNIASRNIDFRNLDQGIAELAWVKDTYQPLIDGGIDREASSFLSALDAIDKKWGELVDHANRLGLASTKLSEAWAAATAQAQYQRDRAIDQVRGGITQRQWRQNGDTLGADLLGFDLGAVQERDDLRTKLTDLAEPQAVIDAWVEALRVVQGQERQDIIDRFNQPDRDWRLNAYDKVIDGTAASSFAQQLQSINTSWIEMIATATRLGLATDALNEAWNKAQVGAWEARLRAINQATGGIQARGMRLAGDEQGAELLGYNIGALQERADLQTTLANLSVPAAEIGSWLLQLEEVQGKERLAIVKKYTDQINQVEDQRRNTASNVVTSLSSYARGLRSGDLTPLSAQSQYSLASSEWQAVSGTALAGNIESLSQLPGYADTLLRASREINGSGSAYVADFERVLAALEKAGELPQDVLTASVLTAETRTQTQILSTKLGELVTEVVALRREVAQGANAPARAAA